MEHQVVRLERLALRGRLSLVSNRVLPERLERRLVQLVPLELQDKPGKSQDERLSLDLRLPGQLPLKPVLEVSELEQSPVVWEERQFPEHQPLPAERSELLLQEQLANLDRLRTPLRLDSSVRTPTQRQLVRLIQPLRLVQLLRPDKRWPVLPGRIPSLLQTESRQDLEHLRINLAVPEEYRLPAPLRELLRPHPLASLPSPLLYPSPILIPFQLFLEILIPLLLQLPIRNSNSRLLLALLPLTLSAKLPLPQPVHEPVSRLLASQVPQDSAIPSPRPRNELDRASLRLRSRAVSACSRS